MSNRATVKSTTTAEIINNCNNQRRQCVASNISDPDPSNAYQLQRCQTDHTKCVKAATSNNIRPGRR